MTDFARFISIIGHPFVVMMVLILATTGRKTSLTFLLIAIVPMLIVSIVQVRRGKWEHVDASNRGERRSLYVAGLIVAIVWVAYLALAQHAVPWKAVVVIGMMLVCAAITRWWLKVSLHLFFATMAGVVLPAMLVLVPLLAWSRLHLRRHTPAEVVVGAVLGAVTGFLLRVV